MKSYFRILRVSSQAVLVSLALAPAAHAAQQIVLVNDQAQIVTLAESPSTVIVGNPSIADVTTEGRMLFFHPRGFGVTNVIALDPEGKKLGDYVVNIVYDNRYTVSMYSPTGRSTFNCQRDCETTMRIGDRQQYFDIYNTQAGNKNSLATGQAQGEDVASSTQQGVTNMVVTPR